MKRIIYRLAVAVAQWAIEAKTKTETATARDWKAAYAQWETVAEKWRIEFVAVATQFTKETGRGLNLGLIHTGQLEGGVYGSGLPLFWSTDYFQPAESKAVADVLVVTHGDTAHVQSVQQLREETLRLLRVRPAAFVDWVCGSRGEGAVNATGGTANEKGSDTSAEG